MLPTILLFSQPLVCLLHFCSPILGVIADRVPIKKKILWVYTIVGVIFTALMGLAPFMGDTAYIWLAIFIVIGNIGFAGGNVIYYAHAILSPT